MTTIPELIKIEQKINSHLQIIKQAEDESIREVLKFFKIPEIKEEGHNISIQELLQKDKIYIILHPSAYNKIDFTQFKLPKKLIIHEALYVSNQAMIYGEHDFDMFSLPSMTMEEARESMLKEYLFKYKPE